MKSYRHLFFDLDHTIWDFERNSRDVLAELHADFGLEGLGVAKRPFIAAYEEVNAALWIQHEAGEIPKEVLRSLRFNLALRHFGLHKPALAAHLDKAYMERCPQRSALMPGALALLEDLRPHFGLHIITNGFTEIQALKLDAAGIRKFFDVVLTSEMAGVAKPGKGIFRHALRSAGARADESLMIGDNARTDMAGARNAGMDQAHLSPPSGRDPEATYGIGRLDELRAVLFQGHLEPSGTKP
ncbi:MAG: YjjG family noncanonical pyrimidine nucleotidase [Bacteroidetes bacterium]|nr:YjjG family noncanonical pyrimidine nucleotidase [Bacteroidota bacterium]